MIISSILGRSIIVKILKFFGSTYRWDNYVIPIFYTAYGNGLYYSNSLTIDGFKKKYIIGYVRISYA